MSKVMHDHLSNSGLFLVQPCGKIDSEDGMFFRKGENFNQGTIFDFNEDDFISACEETIKKVESSRVNEEGLKIQKDFPISRTTDIILSHLE